MARKTRGYDYDLIENDGQIFFADRDTGKVEKADIIHIPHGSTAIIETPKERERKEQRKVQQREHFHKKLQARELGNFFFVATGGGYRDIKAESLARLIYLCSFLKWGQSGLYATERTPMKRKDLTYILKVSKATVSRFLGEVSPHYLKTDEDGWLQVADESFCRGKLPKRKEDRSRLKFYIDTMQRLYQITPSTNHKHLGYMFWMLPFISIHYNMLCWNPMEKDIEAVQYLTVKDFCEGIGMSVASAAELVEIYERILFPVDGHMEPFCIFAHKGTDLENAKIFVNPRIVFSGKEFGTVQKLIASLCKVP